MVTLALAVVAYLRALFLSRHTLALEAVALRQQLAVFKRKQPRPKLHHLDRLFWIALRRLWPGWTEAPVIVKPETVVSWHRAGFRLFWRFRSRFRRPGRPKVSGEIRQLIRRMKADNPNWGAPRIHGERSPTAHGTALNDPHARSRRRHRCSAESPYEATLQLCRASTHGGVRREWQRAEPCGIVAHPVDLKAIPQLAYNAE